MSAKFSSAYKAKMKRIEQLPKLGLDMMFGALKKDSLGLIKTFHDGIKINMLGLQSLTQPTIDDKKSQGMSKPKSPLYGMGDDKNDRSYANMLRIRRLKNGWKVYPSWAKHHKSALQLRRLFKIHEFGCTIRVTPKMRTFLARAKGIFLRSDTKTVRIPPRPAFMLSYRKWMGKRKGDETGKKVRKAMTEYVNKGFSKYMDEYIAILGKKESEGA